MRRTKRRSGSFQEGLKVAYISSAERLGIKKGMEKGIEKGMEKGMEKGILQIAKKMKEMGEDPAKIALITELPEEEISRL